MGTNERRRRALWREGIILVVLVAAAVAAFYYYVEYRARGQVVQASFLTEQRESEPLTLRVAATDDARRKGLMFVKVLPKREGMIFVERSDRVQQFWMKDTYIPLDMIFLDRDFRVLGVLEKVAPLTTESRRIEVPSRYVVELNGGEAAELGVSKGSTLKLIRGELPR